MTKYLITSALPYINGIKHLGNLVGSMLPADVYARFLRQKGEEVLYICATDEHGTPAELAALEKIRTLKLFARNNTKCKRIFIPVFICLSIISAVLLPRRIPS